MLDVNILLKKSEHYDFRNNILKLLQSYLTERKQFIYLQNKRSITWNMPNSSVIQGSRLLGLLYVCYVNEINDLHKIMSKYIYTTIMDRQTKIYMDIDHNTISNTNIVSSYQNKILLQF